MDSGVDPLFALEEIGRLTTGLLPTMTSLSKPDHFRPDIEGLRAVAVLGVLLFHFEVFGFAGGFVGVDVFFVISGHLMTRIVQGRNRSGFSLPAFYVARLFRIYPPLLAMILTLLCLGYWFLDPTEYSSLGRHAAASILSVVNFVFVSEGDYFAPATEANWLLHTWSLSVEVQFYVVFPIILVLMRRHRLLAIAAWCLLCFLSLVGCVVLTKANASAAFFLLPSRLWEFLAGALACFWSERASNRWAGLVSKCGLLLVVASILVLRPGPAFPGYAAAVPVLGAALVVASPSNLSLLCNPVSRVLGSISYSLYLWHWPIWVAARHYGVEPTCLHQFGLIAASIASGSASYLVVERPANQRRHTRVDLGFSGALGAAAAVCLALSGVVALDNGLPTRAPDLIRSVADRHQADVASLHRESDGYCFLVPIKVESEFAERCFNPKMPADGLPVLFWGDSYADALWVGAADVPELAGVKLLEGTAASCLPVLNAPALLNPNCPAVNLRVLAEIKNRRPKVVIMFARWQYYDTHDTDVIASLRETIRALEADGTKILLIGPNPEWTPTLPQQLFQLSFLRGGSIPERLKDNSHEVGLALDRRMAKLAAEMHVGFMSLFARLCNTDGCLTQVDGLARRDLIDYDHGHLSVPGGNWVASRVLADHVGRFVKGKE